MPVQRAVELLHNTGPTRLAARSVLHVEPLGLIPLGLVGLGVPVVHLTLLQGHKRCAAAVVKNSTVCGHGARGGTANAGLLARALIPANLLARTQIPARLTRGPHE